MVGFFDVIEEVPDLARPETTVAAEGANRRDLAGARPAGHRLRIDAEHRRDLRGSQKGFVVVSFHGLRLVENVRVTCSYVESVRVKSTGSAPQPLHFPPRLLPRHRDSYGFGNLLRGCHVDTYRPVLCVGDESCVTVSSPDAIAVIGIVGHHVADRTKGIKDVCVLVTDSAGAGYADAGAGISGFPRISGFPGQLVARVSGW